MPTEPIPQLDPELLVARIIAELQANPEAQPLLLRAMLTNEFLGMPARLDRIEKDVAELKVDVAQLKADMVEVKADIAVLKTDVAVLKTDVAVLKTDVAVLKTDVAVLKTDVAVLKTDVAQLKGDVGYLRGSDLEIRLHRNLRSIVSQRLDLIRPRIMQSQLQEPINEFADEIHDAYREGRISSDQYRRLERTDFIMRAQQLDNHSLILVAVEASATVDAHDIERARESADALATVFGTDTIAVVSGYRIDPRDLTKAEDVSVRYVQAN